MKPLKLIMEGFGPFVEKTEIDFSKLDDGLTLITGNTGAGKTTIFDAICCALYGETSGQSRSFSQMRSKSAEDNQTTRVEFSFELQGEIYKVERTPTYTRNKLRGEGTTQVPARAQLTLPNGKVVEKAALVTEEVIKLLGIKRQEFRQIVMIAQNEFMGMIVGTNKEQEETFNRIFGAELFREFDRRIRERKKETGEDYQASLNELKSLLLEVEDLKVIEDDLSTIKKTLETKLKTESDELGKRREAYRDRKKTLEEIRYRIRSAEELEKEFSEKEERERELERVKKERAAFEKLSARISLLESARDKVAKSYEYLSEVKADLEETTKRHQSKQDDYLRVKAQLIKAKEERESYSEKALQKYLSEVESAEAKIPEYETVETTRKRRDEARESYEKYQSLLAQLDQRIRECEKIIETTKILPESHFLNTYDSLTSEKFVH